MFRVTNQTDAVEIMLYDTIGGYTDPWTGEEVGVSAKTFKEALDEANGRPVHLHIDSGGGDVFEAFAMCSAIQRYEGKVTAYVDGLAASAASYIAVVCDDVIMNDYAYLMIHCAITYAWGNARELEDTAARLRNIDSNLAQIYEKRSNLSLEEVLAYMEDETWFTAAEAFRCGLATEVVETEQRMAASIDKNLAKNYKHVPENLTQHITVRACNPSTITAENITTGETAATIAGNSHAKPTVDTNEAVSKAALVMDGRIYY